MNRRTKILMITVPLAVLIAAGATWLPSFAAEYKKNAVIEQIVAYLKGKDVDMHEDNLKLVAHKVYDVSQQHDIDYRLALAVIKVESNFKNQAVSRKGARGLFQIKPSLAKHISKDAGVTLNGIDSLHESDKNIKLGVYHLSKLVDDFKNVPTALHAYNVGEAKAKSRPAGKGVPKTTFTKRVLREYEKNLSVLPEVE